MVLRDVVEGLKQKPIVIKGSETLRVVVSVMNERNVGAVMVSDENGALSGILSERDIMRHIEKAGLDVPAFRVATPRHKIVFGRPEDEVSKAMLMMDKFHIRHLPVLDAEGALVALLSIRDLMRTQLEDVEYERKALMGYIVGSYPNA